MAMPVRSRFRTRITKVATHSHSRNNKLKTCTTKRAPASDPGVAPREETTTYGACDKLPARHEYGSGDERLDSAAKFLRPREQGKAATRSGASLAAACDGPSRATTFVFSGFHEDPTHDAVVRRGRGFLEPFCAAVSCHAGCRRGRLSTAEPHALWFVALIYRQAPPPC
jgi:hypothetical protein